MFEIAQVERMSGFDLARRIIEIYNSENATVSEYKWLVAKSKDDYAKHILNKTLSSRQVNYMRAYDIDDVILDEAGELAEALNILSEIEKEQQLRTTTKIKQATDDFINSEELRKLAGLDQINEITDESAKEVIMQILNSYGKDVDLETECRNYFPRLSDKEVDYYLKGYKKPELKLVKNEAEYQGRKVKLNKPTRGDVKKFKVYVKDPKTGNVKKVNFGHGGTSAKKAGQKTMKIKKSNPARRKSFRARHNCDNPGPKTKARYWSCRAW